MHWLLELMAEMSRNDLLTKPGSKMPLKFDAVFRAADGPQISHDTMSRDAGYLLFSLRSANLYLDIPIVDPTAHGSNGDYVWPDDMPKRVPWEDKQDKLVFRGTVSFPIGVNNWHTVPRIRAAQLAQKYPDMYDIGITKWHA